MSDAPLGPGWWQAGDGKWYAPQPYPQQAPPGWQPQPGWPGPPGGYIPPKKRKAWPWVVGSISVFLVLVVIVAVAAPPPEKDNKASAPASVSPLNSAAQTVPDAPAGIGTPVKTGDYNVTVISVTDPFTPSNQFGRAKPGNRIVRIEMQLENTSSAQQIFSTLGQLNVQDSASRTYSISITGEPGDPSIEGIVQPKSSSRGFVYFELPADATGLQLLVQGSFFGDAKSIPLV